MSRGTLLGLVLQHEEDVPPGLLAEWLEARGISYRLHRGWEEELPDEPSGERFVISLGSRHSARESEGWVPGEVELLGRAVEQEVPVLGICFGSQALAVALGGRIAANDPGWVGWQEVETADAGLVPTGPWAYFNREVFTTPPGGRELARTPHGPTAFRRGRALGVQFHPEVSPDVLDRWARRDPERLAGAGSTAAELLERSRRHFPAAARQARRLFDAWWRRLAASG